MAEDNDNEWFLQLSDYTKLKDRRLELLPDTCFWKTRLQKLDQEPPVTDKARHFRAWHLSLRWSVRKWPSYHRQCAGRITDGVLRARARGDRFSGASRG